MSNDNVVVLPYGNPPTSGHAGSQTSRERAIAQDSDGTTSSRQKAVLDLLNRAGYGGATWSEVAAALGIHHGAASGVLSNLHRAGKVVRLVNTRGRSKVYVLAQYQDNRAAENPGRTGTRALMDSLAVLVNEADARTAHSHLPNIYDPTCWSCRAGEALRHYDAITGKHL